MEGFPSKYSLPLPLKLCCTNRPRCSYRWLRRLPILLLWCWTWDLFGFWSPGRSSDPLFALALNSLFHSFAVSFMSTITLLIPHVVWPYSSFISSSGSPTLLLVLVSWPWEFSLDHSSSETLSSLFISRQRKIIIGFLVHLYAQYQYNHYKKIRCILRVAKDAHIHTTFCYTALVADPFKERRTARSTGVIWHVLANLWVSR